MTITNKKTLLGTTHNHGPVRLLCTTGNTRHAAATPPVDPDIESNAPIQCIAL